MPTLAGNNHLSIHFFLHGQRLFHLSTEKGTGPIRRKWTWNWLFSNNSIDMNYGHQLCSSCSLKKLLVIHVDWASVEQKMNFLPDVTKMKLLSVNEDWKKARVVDTSSREAWKNVMKKAPRVIRLITSTKLRRKRRCEKLWMNFCTQMKLWKNLAKRTHTVVAILWARTLSRLVD